MGDVVILGSNGRPMRDGFVNAVTGAGTTTDSSVYRFYQLQRLAPQQIDAAYRQSWLMRKAIDLPPFDMTRAWRDWQADEDQIEAIEAEETRLGLREKIRRALILGRLGGAALLIGMKGGNPATPLDPETVTLGSIAYIHVLSRWQLTMVDGGIDRDPSSETFGQPKMWALSGTDAKIHPSRVICFKGQQTADFYGFADQETFWGDSVCQAIMDAIKNADEAQSGFAALIKEAKLDIIGIPNLTSNFSTAEYEKQLTQRLTAANLAKSLHNALIIDSGNGQSGAGESWEQRQVTWTGMPEMIQMFLSIVAGAADIPATRLLGKSPDGMNATGQSDQSNYDQMISARQEADLGPTLMPLDEILIRSATGARDPNIHYDWATLSVMTEEEQSKVDKTKAETVQIYATTGLVPTIALEKGVQNMLIEDGTFPGLDGALNVLAEDERFPSLDPANQTDPSLPDPTAIPGQSAVPAAAIPKRRVANDARFADAEPQSLYISRKLLNATEFTKWARGQGFDTTTPPDELHVTIAFSRTPVDWMKVGQDWSSDKDGKLVVSAGGPRIVQKLGDKGAAVLLFQSDDLKWRHEAIKEAGASFDFDEYQPHVTITYQVPAGLDLSKVEPYTGPLVFGPELFAQVVDDWEQTVSEE